MVGVEDIPRGTERLNRYSNVLPSESERRARSPPHLHPLTPLIPSPAAPKTRVHLTLKHNHPNSDYINANHIRV